MIVRDDPAQNIPPGWALATVGDIADYVNGLAFKPSDWEAKGRPIIRIQNLTGQSDHLNLTTRQVEPAYIVQPGTILVSWSATLDVFVWRGPEALLNQHIFKVVPVARMSDHSFVRWALKNAIDEMWRGEHTHGTTMRHINRGPFLAHRLSLPPVKEQVRIADAIESYLSRLDDAVASLERVQAKLKAYRTSVLKAAVEGRLVPTEAFLARAEKRDYEPAEVLLSRILKERRRRWEEAELARLNAAGKTPKDGKWKAQYREPVDPSDTSTLPELPEGWCWASADALTEANRSITYGVVKLGETTKGGVPTLRSSNVRHLWLDSEYVKPVSPRIANQYRRTILEGGEVLVTVRGTLGGVAVAPHSARGWNISREVAILALVEPKLGSLVADFIGSPFLQAWMMRRTRGNTYTGINIETLKEMPIPIPPFPEAARVVDQVESILSVAAVASDAVVRDVHKVGRLRQSILKWAFEGKLIAQNPNDEPADRLLARIRAERADVATSKKSRGRKAKVAA